MRCAPCSRPASGSAPGGADPGVRILVEFVSANPTGPLVAASGRHAAYGDALSRILAHHGHQVWREYYFNDAGSQIRLLGESVQARARGEAVPEGGYQGDYIAELAGQIEGVAEMSVPEASARAVELLLAQIKATLERYGVHYDQFFSERLLHEGSPSYLDRALALVAEGGHSLRVRRRAVAAHHHLRRRQGPRAASLRRRPHVLRRRPRLPAGEAGARRRPAAAAGGIRPSRLRGPDECGVPGARRRPRSPRVADPAVRPSDRGPGAGGDVQAPRRIHHPRRAPRRDRRRRHSLLHAAALP